MTCKKCNDTGIVQRGLVVKACDCGAFERVTEDAITDVRIEVGDRDTARLLRAENDTLTRRVRELEGIIEHGTAENKRQHDELVELRSAITAGDKTVTALRERAEKAERALAEQQAANADTTRTTTDTAQRKAK